MNDPGIQVKHFFIPFAKENPDAHINHKERKKKIPIYV